MSELSKEQEDHKRAMFEKLSPRRRKFIERLGYENWDPYFTPKDPIEIRQDPSRRTAAQLIRDFTATRGEAKASPAYQARVAEMALGLIQDDDRIRAMYDFSVWYKEILHKEGVE